MYRSAASFGVNLPKIAVLGDCAVRGSLIFGEFASETPGLASSKSVSLKSVMMPPLSDTSSAFVIFSILIKFAWSSLETTNGFVIVPLNPRFEEIVDS